MPVTLENATLLIGSLVIVLFLFVGLLYPSMVETIQGECWRQVKINAIEDIESAMNRVTGEYPQKVKIRLGECVEKFIITHRDNFQEVTRGLKEDVVCLPGLSSVIVVTPNLKWYQFIKKQTVDPICQKIPCSKSNCFIVGDPLDLDGPGKNEEPKEYCVQIIYDSPSSYRVSQVDLKECE